MKRLGQVFVVMAVGGAVLLAAYALTAALPQWRDVGMSFGAALLLGACGAILLNWSARKALLNEADADLDPSTVEEQLSRVVNTLQVMNTNSESINVQEIGPMIDAQLAEDVSGCGQAIVFLTSHPECNSFNDVQVCFDAGQLSIRQARSASALGNAEEVWDSLSSAEERMAEAVSLLRRHRHQTDHPSRN